MPTHRLLIILKTITFCGVLIFLSNSCKKDPVIWSRVMVRGPYLQMLGKNEVTIKWKTSTKLESVVNYGNSPQSLTQSALSNIPVEDHEIQIKGLNPSTKYYYSIGTSERIIEGDSANYFITAPLEGSNHKTRIWAIGDAGSGYPAENMVRDGYLKYNGNNPTDVWLWLGDNAYKSGTEQEFNKHVFNGHFENILKNTCAWPVAGNHDFANRGYLSHASRTKEFPYHDLFSLPQHGEFGGIASGTENYYSFNYSNIHFIALDSYGSYNTPGSPMYNWLINDLASNTQKWIIVFFHHPPYSKGHDSDISEEQIDIRKNIIPVLENYGADLVLSGHSHNYERSYLLNGHYGNESSLNSSMILDHNNGKLPSPYLKSNSANKGTVYIVAGSSGKSGTPGAGWPHDAMFYSDYSINGSLAIDVDQNILTSRFLDVHGNVVDEFSIQKF